MFSSGYYDKRVIEVTGCYAVPFSELRPTPDADEEPKIDMEFSNRMYEMAQKALPAEIPVGW